ncbi:DNA primase [Sphingopyxis italica]|uniref:DNA primase n=1 Tax=Sphingopyxis italica TaxID=1129133 RepID=A0A7X5XQK4_9SPHN|nr:toprim domain-containing protein [Sphingopyxis italica]NJB89484.1 DNA primase [Sphingopyxis italica]
MKFDLERIKAIPIATVASDLGFVLSPKGAGRCRFPGHPDQRPSFSLRPASNGFNCFGCQRSGSVIDLVMAMNSIDFAPACRWLNDNYLSGNGALSRSRAPRLKSTETLPVSVQPSSHRVDPEIYGWILDQSPLTESGRSYLQRRAFSAETIAHFQIGQIGDRATLWRSAIATFGMARLDGAGLVIEGRYGPLLCFPSQYLLFPFLQDGSVVYLQARRTDDQKQYRWFCPAKILPPPFNLDALGKPGPTITVCEGITDVLSAHELGMLPIGLLGATRELEPQIIDCLIGRNVAIFTDADPAGRGLAKRLRDRLAARGISVVTKNLPPEANDLNDYLRSRRGIT